jgi:hypothetical protein
MNASHDHEGILKDEKEQNKKANKKKKKQVSCPIEHPVCVGDKE